jgi:uncharacterized protein
MAAQELTFKIVVAGAFGVGKTTLINHISDTPVVGTEVATSGDEAESKSSTTVGLEYGTYRLVDDEFDISLLLFGTPGQERFRFMWDIVSIGADAALVLVDAQNDATWDDARAALAYFRASATRTVALGVNRLAASTAIDEFLLRFNDPTNSVAIACNAIDRESARSAIVEVLSLVLDDAESLLQDELV